MIGLLATHFSSASTDTLQYRDQTLTVQGDTRTVRIPVGYTLEVLTTELKSPRMITFAQNGDLFIGSRRAVYRLPAPYTQPEVLVALRDYPHSVAFREGEILIAMIDGVYHAPYQLGRGRLSKSSLELLAELPAGRGHSSRTVAVGPDGRVYVSLGIAGNCSNQYLDESYSFDERRGGVLVLNEDGAKPRWETFASGLRNPVGFDWHPDTGVLYASNNGPDHLGFDMPPEYFSRLHAGSFHGMPWFQYDGENIKRDPCISTTPPRPVADVLQPVATFPARNAPLGMAFVPSGGMDSRLVGDAIVALHGSWATSPQGNRAGDSATRRHPKVVVVRFENGNAQRVDDLITGFQAQDGSRWGRPAGVRVGPDGALYFTSDAGVEGLFRLRPTQ